MKRLSLIVYIFIIVDMALIALGVKFGFASETCFTSTVAHTETTKYNWYYKPRTDGLQPEKNAEMMFIYDHNAYGIGDPDEDVIYLTFDAGYDNGYTEDILDTLKSHNVPAAFFLVEHYITSNPEIVKRMAEEGHLVCNHTTHHKDMSALTDFDAFAKEMQDIEQTYTELTGQTMAKFFRPPSGQFSERCLQYADQLGYTTVFWSFAYRDWYVDDQPSEAEAIDTIISRTHPGEIALLHLTSETNARVLDTILAQWKDMGYRFESLDHLIDTYDPTDN